VQQTPTNSDISSAQPRQTGCFVLAGVLDTG